jgi:hypothetical protein
VRAQHKNSPYGKGVQNNTCPQKNRTLYVNPEVTLIAINEFTLAPNVMEPYYKMGDGDTLRACGGQINVSDLII